MYYKYIQIDKKSTSGLAIAIAYQLGHVGQQKAGLFIQLLILLIESISVFEVDGSKNISNKVNLFDKDAIYHGHCSDNR